MLPKKLFDMTLNELLQPIRTTSLFMTLYITHCTRLIFRDTLCLRGQLRNFHY